MPVKKKGDVEIFFFLSNSSRIWSIFACFEIIFLAPFNICFWDVFWSFASIFDE